MENLEIAKNISTIASPFIKAVVETWVTPKLKSIGEKWKREDNLIEHAFNNKFEEYLLNRYKTYSIINIIAFHNQQRLLKDIYIPLTIHYLRVIIDKKDPSLGKIDELEFKLTGYNKKLFSEFKKILIVDTAGMGKSTISKKLFLSFIEENKGIPIFIELRRLNRMNFIIDEIFKEVKLINEEIDRSLILDLIKRGDFIFFLDGYDEIPLPEKSKVTEDIQRFVNIAIENTFILTSRQDESLSSFGNFQSFSINPLKQDEVYQLLKNYDGNGKLSKSLILELEGQSYVHLAEFLGNPLLGSLLYTAYQYKHKIPLKKHVFYRQVYDALYESHDLSKGDYFQRSKISGLDIDDFHTVLRYLSFVCLKKDRIEFSKDELLNLIEEVKKECDTIHFEKSAFVKDLIISVPIFIKEGLYYKWTHKSIFEYFVACFINQDSGSKKSLLLKKLSKVQYFNIIDIYSKLDYRTFRNTIVKDHVEEFVAYCEKKYGNSSISFDSIIRRKELVFEMGSQSFHFNPRVFGFSLRIDSISRIRYNNCLSSFLLPNLYSNGEKFVKIIIDKENIEFRDLIIDKCDSVIKQKTQIELDFDPQSMINQKTNFDLFSSILERSTKFVRNNSFNDLKFGSNDNQCQRVIYDYKECKKFLEKINEKKEFQEDSDFWKID